MAITSQQQIQVLHVDDEPEFIDLTRTLLQDENDRFAIETATSADEGLERISDRPPDCVVSDYNMPGTDGIEFLQAVREGYPDLPFILFTGKGSEEVASDAISAGATDYLQKQSGTEQYSLLANRVLNAVNQYRSKQRLRKTQQEYTAIFENAQNALILVQVEDDGFRYQQCNPRAVELIGRDKTEIVGNTPSEALGPENGTKVIGAYRTCIERRTTVEYTVRLDLPMGPVIRECEVAPVATNGEIEQLVVEFRDITEQRQRQQELEEYGTIIKALTDAVYVLDEEGRFTYVNDEFVELVGYDRETILGNTPSLIKDEAAVEQAERQLGRLLSNDGPETVSFEVMVQPRDGDPIVCEDHMGVLPYKGDQFNGSVGTLRDITDRKERERELAQTHDLMANMEQLADVGAWEYDSDTETLVMTDGAYRIHGLDPEMDLTPETAFDNFHDDDRDRFADRFDECLETGEPYEITLQLTTAEGVQRWISARGERVSDNGDGRMVRGYIQDITEQRAHERNLERYRTVLNALPSPVVVYDEDGRYAIINEAAAEIRDVPREELKGTKSPYLEQIREENPAEYDALVEEKRDTLTVELTAEFSGPGKRTLECGLSRLTDAEELDGIVIVTRDVTDRKEHERQLRRERQRYTTLFETLPNPVLHARTEDGEPVVQTVNPAFEDTFGYDAETIRDEPIQEYVLPDNQADAAHQLNQQVLTEGDVQTEVQRETTEGVRTFRLNVSTRNTENGDHEGYAVYTDITERKQMERALKQERDLVTGIVETAPVGISVVDPEGSISFVNEQMESISGRALEQFGEVPYDDPQFDLVDRHRDPLGPGDTPFEHVVSREAAIHNQVVGFRRPSGERVWVSVSGAPQYNDDELERAVFAFEDITKQRELEAELSTILGRISDAFFALDEEFRFTHVNDRAEEMLEASEDQLLGETPWDIYPETEESDKIFDSLRAAMDTQTPQSRELHYELRDEWFETTVYPSESGLSVYFQDVTEQKEREQELRELKSQYETLAENFPDGAVYLIDTDLHFVHARGEELSRVGLSPNDFKGKNPNDLFPEEIADKLCHHLEKALDGHAYTFEQEYGGERYRLQAVPVRTNDEEITHVMGVSQNITEYAEDKQNLERQNERLEEFASIVSHDLRNPLSVADGHLELAQDTCESDHLAQAADAIDRSQALIDDLLMLAQEGQEVAEVEPVALVEVAESSWQTVETGPATLENDAPQVVRANQSRLRQLFENLYRNAVEHGGEDVTVSVGAIDDGFYVADTGPGIPVSDREKVFEAGYSTSHEGTGFGLRIVEQIADAHGWKITVTESEQGGARFECTGVERVDR